MGYEVDFLNVGDGERSGDALCLRFGDLHGDREGQFVMVIDGGTLDSGERLVKHIREFYSTDRVDLVVSTHPDNDHISGLRTVVNEMAVDRLWMHRPWLHSEDFKALFKSRTLTTAGLRDSIRASLDTASDLEELALKKGIPIAEPFADVALPFSDIGIQVLGPTTTYYEELLPQFRDTPKAAAAPEPGFMQRAGTALLEIAAKVAEEWGIETLSEPAEDATSAENNSSVILTVQRDGKRLLFTGDAGVPALDRAADAAEILGIDLPGCSFVQVPHHGSKRNVGPTVLDRILGPKGKDAHKSAFISAATKSEKHPAKKVCNAFQRRGARERLYATKGSPKNHFNDAPDRGWPTATSLPFYDEVED